MLCLTRRIGERLIFTLPDGGGEVAVTVLAGYQHLKVRLGVEAPPGVTIFREELREYFAGGRGRAGGKQGPEAAQETAAPPAATPSPDEVRALLIDVRRYVTYHGHLIGECVAWGKLKAAFGVGDEGITKGDGES